MTTILILKLCLVPPDLPGNADRAALGTACGWLVFGLVSKRGMRFATKDQARRA
jgi:hypothetical protein